MSQEVGWPYAPSRGEFIVPGTSFVPSAGAARRGDSSDGPLARDPVLRNLYLCVALGDVPRLLGAVDRNPYRPTYGCLDRQYWHYRSSGFPSQVYQEGALPLALLYATKLPGNRWHEDARVRELAIAAIRFTATSSHPDGPCDGYCSPEGTLGAAAGSLTAAARAYQVLKLDDPELLRWFRRRAGRLTDHDATGEPANHQALAALGLLRTARITGKREYRDAAEDRIHRLLARQTDEGWFEESGGADPGYQTLTIDCLAKIRRLSGWRELDEPLRRAVAFARMFLHPDGSYAGEYGSRGTCHFWPHGMELLAAGNPEAADLADGFLRGLASGKNAYINDDRMSAHRLGNLIEAYLDFSPVRPPPRDQTPPEPVRYFRKAGLLVRRTGATQTVISAARGGAFKHFTRSGAVVTDTGLIIETSDGRAAVSGVQSLDRPVELASAGKMPAVRMSVSSPLYWSRFRMATPIKQALFHVGSSAVGRWSRSLLRRLLLRRVLADRRGPPVRLKRVFEFLPDREATGRPSLRVTDTIELTSRRTKVRRMSFATDHPSGSVADGDIYQDGIPEPWTDLAAYVQQLNARGRVRVVREL